MIIKELQSHTVYKFSSGNCNVTYYGKKEQHRKIRSSEHITEYCINCINMIAILTTSLSYVEIILVSDFYLKKLS